MLKTLFNSLRPDQRWLAFCAHFQIHFLDTKNLCMYLVSNCTKLVAEGLIGKKVNIGSDNDWALNWQKSITWTNVDQVLWHMSVIRPQWVNEKFKTNIYKTNIIKSSIQQEINDLVQKRCNSSTSATRILSLSHSVINSSPPGENGCHFTDDMFKCIFLNGNIWISNKISSKYVPWVLIDSMSALVRTMTWRPPGDKPLSEPMLTHFTNAYMQH